MKKLIFIIASLLSCMTVFGQFKIDGKIIEADNKPIEFARVVLMKNDTLKFEAFSDAKGQFFFNNINSARYHLKVFYMGTILYQTEISAMADLHLGALKSQAALELSQVEVVGRQKRIERKIDRLIFNVEATSLSAGGDAMDALKITPGIRVMGEDISLVGKDKLRLMIDGKMLNLSGESLNEFLRSISSDNIKSIEVITTPPAKYEAEGNSGILNIILKNNKLDYWNASLGLAYTQRTYGTISNNGNFTYNKKKMSLYANYSLNDGGKVINETSQVYYPDNIWAQANFRKVENKSVTGRLGIAYDFSKNWRSELQYTGSNSKSDLNENPSTTISNYQNGAVDSYINSISESEKRPTLNSFTWNNLVKLDSNGSNILFSLDYFNYGNNDSRHYAGGSFDAVLRSLPGTAFSGFNNNAQRISNFSAKADGASSIKKFNFEYGYQYSASNTDNSIVFLNQSDASGNSTDETSNFFQYREKIHAAYLSADRKFNDKWESKLGLRMEATRSLGLTTLTNSSVAYNYAQLFPSAYLSYTPNENNNFSITYSKRVGRPKFEQLNPFKIYDSPYIYSEGNPFLQPSFTHNMELIHTYKKWENKFYYSYQKGGFEQFGIADPNTNITRFFVDNFLTSNTFGLSESYTFDKISWWTSFNSLDINYSRSTSSNVNTQRARSGYSSYFSSYNDFILSKKNNLNLSLNYWISFPGVDGLDKVSAANSLSVALKALLLKKKLQLTIAGNDVFAGERYTVTSFTNNIKLVYRNYYDNRSLRVSVSYKFGNQKIKVNAGKSGNESERQRATN